MLDVNAGAPVANEPELLEELARKVDAPLCFDGANSTTRYAALAACEGKVLVNSTTGEEKYYTWFCYYSETNFPQTCPYIANTPPAKLLNIPANLSHDSRQYRISRLALRDDFRETDLTARDIHFDIHERAVQTDDRATDHFGKPRRDSVSRAKMIRLRRDGEGTSNQKYRTRVCLAKPAVQTQVTFRRRRENGFLIAEQSRHLRDAFQHVIRFARRAFCIRALRDAGQDERGLHSGVRAHRDIAR